MNNLDLCKITAKLAMGSLFASLVFASSAMTAEKPETVVYECSNETYGYGGWTPRESTLVFSENFETVTISDPFIARYLDELFVSKVKKTRKGALKFRWKLNMRTGEGYKTPVNYKAEFDPKTLKGHIHTNVGTFTDPRLGGRMNCEMSR